MRHRQPAPGHDTHWAGTHAPLVPIDECDRSRRSRYVRMRDGVPIAIDVYLPSQAAARPVSTIIRQTRYGRSFLPRPPFRRLVQQVMDHYQRLRRAFLAAGFAWVDVDVRGSGASGGTQLCPWSPDEVRDGAEIADWIVGQPWSSGKVGSLGISYDGTSAEMLLVNRHPAVRAVAPLFSLFDVYTDVAFPGGVHLAWFTEQWGRLNGLLDGNVPNEAFALVVSMLARASGRLPSWVSESRMLPACAAVFGRLVAGVRPIDPGLLAEVIADHAANFRVHECALAITHRDDDRVLASHPTETVDSFSPHAFVADIAASGAAVYSYSGWRDGAYGHAAIKRHRALAAPGSRLTLGPWIHSGRLAIAPFQPPRPSAFDHAAELIGFFAHHLDGRPDASDGKPVHYFTMGEGRWKRADSWPPPGTHTRTLFLAGGGGLTDRPAERAAEVRYRVDVTAGTGARSRWRGLIAPVPADYPDRAERDEALLVHDSPPLEHALEVTGHPVVTLHVAWLDATDGQVFAYLEDVAPDGRVAHVTEGLLRALHRKAVIGDDGLPVRTFRRADAAPVAPGEVVELVFDLLPVSYRFAAGHRIRLAIAGADADSFGAAAPSTIAVHLGGARASRLELPVMGA